MDNQKLVLLVEAQMLPQHRDRVLSAAKANLPLTLAEPGCESFYLTVSAEDPNKIVFFEMFSSEEAHAFHLEQEYTKRFFASIEGCFASPPKFTRLTLV
jgi:quinol monooxygenase YgiN